MSQKDEEGLKEKYKESNAGDGTVSTDHYLSGVKLALTLISTTLALFGSALDQTIVSTILTQVGSEFNGFDKVEWLTSAYLLPMATLAPSYGRISVALGRKYTILGGLMFFIVGSIVCALSKNMDTIIGGRVIQGIGGGAIQAMVMIILSEVVPINKRPLAMTLIGITFSVASALGPFIGGSFASNVTWRWCFYINLPIAGCASVFLFFAFNPPKPKGKILDNLKTVDYIGTFLMSAGLILILLALTFGGTEFPWRSAAVILCFVLGGLLLVAFTVYNFGFSKYPIIIKEAIIIPQIFFACISGFLAFAQFMINVTYLSIYFQVIKNKDAFHSGIALLPFVLTVSVSSVCNAAFMKITRTVKVTMTLCGVCALIGSGLLLLLDVNTTFGQTFGISIANGIAAGISFQSSLLSTHLMAPRNVTGSLINLTAFNNFCKSTGGVIGISIAQVILKSSLKAKMKHLTIPDLSFDVLGLISNPQMINSLPKAYRKQFLEVFVDSLHNVYYFSIGVSALLVISNIFTTKKKIPKAADIETKKAAVNDESNDDEVKLT